MTSPTLRASSTRPAPYAPWNLGRAAVYRFECVPGDPFPWVAWIPPRGPEDYDGDPTEAPILPPFGGSYWPTWREAYVFVQQVGAGRITVEVPE